MTASLSLHPIPAFKDNYIWCLSDGRQALVVDPGDSTVVTHWLVQQQLTLHTILITHHHADHTAGLNELQQKHAPQTFGPYEDIEGITHLLSGGEHFESFLREPIEVLAIPGHTRAHIGYYLPEQKLLFCGDTLFSAGCGRLFEGTAAQMHHSLSRLAALPDDTLICCTHEYTQSNLRFALVVEPNNAALKIRIAEVEQLRHDGLPSLPVTLGLEKTYNPFLRCHEPSVAEAIFRETGKNHLSTQAVFTELRLWKDRF